MQVTVLILAIAILAVIAYGDMHTRRIPNTLCGAIAMLGLTRISLVHDPAAAAYTLLASATVFAAGFLFFCRGMVGGGDAKLVTAMSLLIGYHDLLRFLFLMSICGGALALAILGRDKLHQQRFNLSRPVIRPFASRATEGAEEMTLTTVPYGVAIAAAGLIMLVFKTDFLK